MKKYLLALLMLFGLSYFDASASHLAGIEISYEYLGAGTAPGSERYRVYVIAYRDAYGINMPTSVNLCIASSCYPSQSVTLPQGTSPIGGYTSGQVVPESDDCSRPANPSGPGGTFEVYYYSGTVTLQGACVDWSFSWNSCCRNSAIDNLTSPSSRDLFGEAKLNNTLGPNSSPFFIKPAAKRFCIVNPNDPLALPFVWAQPTIEADGDSLLYRFANPQEVSGFGCPATGLNIPFAGSYSVNQPMTTTGGIQVDANNGYFTFKPAIEEVVVIRVDVDEYRFNTTRLRWEFVGNTLRDMQVAIDQNCNPEVRNGPKIDITASGFGQTTVSKDSLRSFFGGSGAAQIINNDFVGITNGDSVVNVPIIPYNCGDDIVNLKFGIDIYCPSIDPTDFRIMGPDGISRPVVEVLSDCSSDTIEVDELNLKLHKALDVNGPYVLYIKKGNDGNTLRNKCGYNLVDNFFMIINVTNCPILDYELQNVTVERDEHIRVEFDLDTTSYITSAFSRINVLRANNDQQFIKIGEITDRNATSFLDTTVDGFAVDNQVYQYLLQLFTNDNPRVPTNFVNSIVIDGDSLSDTQLEVEWNPYLNDTYGGVAEYEVFSATEYDSITQEPMWQSEQVVGANLSYVYNMPQEDGIVFWLKVEGFDPSGVNTRRASSNWIIYGSPLPPPPPPGSNPVVEYVPNVITPNGDMVNDRFYFQFNGLQPGTRQYSGLSLSIFNRWGKLVFEDDNYMARNTETDGWDGTDQNTGNRLADGVYFYTARFTDLETGKSEEITGSVTLSGNYR